MSDFFKISNNALVVSFIQTQINKEFELAEILPNRFSQEDNISPLYFTSYGPFDLLEMFTVNSLSMRHYMRMIQLLSNY